MFLYFYQLNPIFAFKTLISTYRNYEMKKKLKKILARYKIRSYINKLLARTYVINVLCIVPNLLYRSLIILPKTRWWASMNMKELFACWPVFSFLSSFYSWFSGLNKLEYILLCKSRCQNWIATLIYSDNLHSNWLNTDKYNIVFCYYRLEYLQISKRKKNLNTCQRNPNNTKQYSFINAFVIMSLVHLTRIPANPKSSTKQRLMN